MATKGIDISEFQGKIAAAQWEDIKKKCDFVIIRFGYRGYCGGKIVQDSQFANNLAQCKNLGIKYGIYFYSQAITAAEATEEVNAIAKLVDVKSCKYGVWCDTELSNNGYGRADKISASARTSAVKAFCDRVGALGGVGGIYCGYYWMRDRLQSAKLTSYPVWCACYLDKCLYTDNNLAMWQYTDENRLAISGFSGLDCNTCYYAEFNASKPVYASATNSTATEKETWTYKYDRQIEKLQRVLNELGAGLSVDGVAGDKTYTACKRHKIENGSKGNLVSWVQTRLNWMGYSCGAVDGIAGAKTMAGIRAFQAFNKLGQGYLGGSDWYYLIK